MTSAHLPFNETPDTILVVETEPTERMLTRIHLERAGFNVLEASDGPEGLTLARDRQPDLIILDIHLPSASSFSICRAIRADKSLAQVPVLLSTGLDDIESIAYGFEAGATDFLTKPTIWALLAYRVKFLLRSAKFERELAEANRLAHANAIALTDSEHQYRNLFHRAPVMMHRIDRNFRIRDVNDVWLTKTGYTKEEVIGRDFVDFLDEVGRNDIKNNTRFILPKVGLVPDQRRRIICKDGGIIDALVTSTAQFDNEQKYLGAHTVIVDVTERIRAETKMREAQETAEAASRAKSVFLATMSHEIRTPLNGIIGMIDLLEQTELDSNQASMIGTVRDSAYSLLNIIGDILDFSKIEAGELTIEQIDMSVTNVVEGVVETLVPLARDKNISLNVFTNPEIPESLSGDPVRIRQILFNLIGNAIKFSERKDGEPAEVHVKADIEPRESKERCIIRLMVSDTGVGISEDHLARLFTPFFQAEDSTVRRFGGTGLGLSICKNLVGLMGGDISVSSQVGEGSTFIVELPMDLGNNARRQPKDRRKNRLKDLRILLITPDPSSRIAAETYLIHEGAQIVASNSMRSAADMIAAARDEDWPFNVAIFSHSQSKAVDTENQMIASLRKDAACADMGFVILSEDRRNRTQAAVPGASLVPKRPLSRSALLRAVLEAAGRPADDVAPICVPKCIAIPAAGMETQSGLILIAEDNAINQLVIQRQLQQFGYSADIASDGAEALEAYRNGDYKLLLTDCHMPEMDGFELTEAIRKEERQTGKRLPIVAITANALQGEADRCLSAGMDDFLTKPVELKKIGAVLERWLQGSTAANAPKNPRARPRPAGAKPAAKPAAAAANFNDDDTSRPIDLAMLSRLLGTDDDNYLKEMIAVYWDTMRDTPAELAQLAAARNASDLRDAAHAAKGASASVGAVPASSLLEKLQFAATDADWAQINGLMPQIETAFADLERFIGRLEAA